MSPCVQPEKFWKVPAIHLKSEHPGEALLSLQMLARPFARISEGNSAKTA
jgi:hypothetical protein